MELTDRALHLALNFALKRNGDATAKFLTILFAIQACKKFRLRFSAPESRNGVMCSLLLFLDRESAQCARCLSKLGFMDNMLAAAFWSMIQRNMPAVV